MTRIIYILEEEHLVIEADVRRKPNTRGGRGARVWQWSPR